MPETVPTASPLQRQAQWLGDYRFSLRLSERGTLLSLGDGIAWIEGLPSAAMDEILQFDDGSRGVVFHLAEDRVGAIMLKQTEKLVAGTSVRLTGAPLAIPTGDELLGRVINPLGEPLDAAQAPHCTGRQWLDVLAPPIVQRDFVHQPLYTGVKIIDTMTPIGKGQRQLIIGDEALGRSSLAIDAVINQRGKDVLCVYVAIGQKRSAVVGLLDILHRHGAMGYTTVVVGEASALPGLQYLAPFAGCAVAESWMHYGRDTLIVYDDLSTHARAYRELSLLLRRPPGREAYPGDIFYLHARLLERATCLAPQFGGGSMTALPIVETQQGEISAYIPTNLISITDGQLYLDQKLFVSGFRPAIDIRRSVSRIGGKAQHPRVKEEAGRIKLDYLQFLELEVFTRFGAKLEASMEALIKRGNVLRELLKQDRLAPLPIEFQLAWLIAFNEHLLDELDPTRVQALMQGLEQQVSDSGLTLDHERATWVEALSRWLAPTSGRPA